MILRIVLIAAVLSLALAASARGNSQGTGSFGASLEERMLADAADGRLDVYTPLEAALIAGGVSEESELSRVVRSLHALADEAPPRPDGSLRSQAQDMHDLLHGAVLTGAYNDDTADVRSTLTGGDYNCLTATILYIELCRRRGLAAFAVSLPGHVYSRVESRVSGSAESVDVQTTYRDWFRSASVWETQKPAGRCLKPTELIAKLYYNRGVRRHRQQRYAESVASLRTACSLDAEDAAARDNLLAAINNWALAECAAGRYRRAGELLAEGIRADATFKAFAENDVYVAGRWADSLCGQHDYRGALQVLQAAQSRHPDDTLLERAIESVRAAQARHRGEKVRQTSSPPLQQTFAGP
jgi:hypothetical protein